MHTIKNPDQSQTDCSPYNCEGTTCKMSCGSVNDCAPGNVCDTNGHCAPAAQQAGDSGGCAVARGAGGDAGDWEGAALVAIVAVAATRRRRRA
jgi:MYXO-CTERM domain-containing protein